MAIRMISGIILMMSLDYRVGKKVQSQSFSFQKLYKILHISAVFFYSPCIFWGQLKEEFFENGGGGAEAICQNLDFRSNFP